MPEASLPAADSRLLEVRDLRTYFYTMEGIGRAVDGVSLHIAPRETLGIVGESGCGKSVTALSIMRLIPQPPGRIVSGEILFQGHSVLDYPEERMREIRGNEISMVFQEPMTSLNPVFTIGYQIMEAVLLHQRVGKKEARKRTIEMLHLVGIPSPEQRVDEYPHQLSGGMRQRAMIAMALSCDPSLLIADEPATALDVTIQAQILELLQRLQTELGMAVMLITHDLGVIAGYARRVIVMYAGQVVEEAPTAELFASPQHPYTQGLLRSIPRLTARGVRLAVIPGTVPNATEFPPGCRFHPRCPLAMERCQAEEPPLFLLGEGRAARCWLLEREGRT